MPQATNRGAHMDLSLQTLLKQRITSMLFSPVSWLATCWTETSFASANVVCMSVCSHEYQMIMNIVWKRVSDTGKNWRHVYKVRNCPGTTNIQTLFIFWEICENINNYYINILKTWNWFFSLPCFRDWLSWITWWRMVLNELLMT